MFAFINEEKMPGFLSRDHFRIWRVKVNNALSIFGPDQEAPMCLNIKFSEEEKTATYGTMSLADIKNEIRKLWKTNKHIEGILNQIPEIEDYYREGTAPYLAEAISSCNPEVPYKEIREKLDELFGMGEFIVQIAGEYCHAARTITLYTRNIISTATHGRTPEENFEAVFAHELFHAYHYQGNDKELICRCDYTSNVVKESLAAAFEWHYCNERGIAGNAMPHKTWKRHSVLVYPYSGARYLFDPVSFALQDADFCNVFQMSLTDMDGALRVLVPSCRFYAIKNQQLFNLRLAFDKLMKQDAIGVIAHREIPAIIRERKNRLLIPRLLDLNYSNIHFHATQYPILATAPMCDKAGREKSYADPVHRIGKTNYYLTAQWTEDQRDLLLDWIWEHR